ncbi:DUF1553 domain-containing protein [bacterium]|nr:DUF1553 domain-containing protein [bacterium]
MSLAAVVLSTSAFSLIAADPGTASPSSVEFFEKKIRPLLVNNCYTCHSAETNSKGGLRVDDRNGLITGGGRGSALTPGDPEKSLLIEAVTHAGDLKMPPNKKLSDEEISDLTKWVKDGAAWPQEAIPVDLGQSAEEYKKLKREHWAWQSLTNPRPPVVKNTDWPRDDIDRFVLATLEQSNLKPVNDADRVILLRRVTFDLTGLPPTPDQISAFICDDSPDAFAQVVDRLLASNAFGERWGRHWLDVARYGESTGGSRNIPYPQATRYRDYVIDSFNNDKPYDKFVTEQIAGDLLASQNREEKDERLIATGFLAIGVKDVNQRFKVRFVMDNIDEQIDTVSRSLLGLTVSCARCHDHKFDPIPAADYYALAGIFHSTDDCAGVRNKMGGGGLDYYDNEMLLQVGEPKELKPEDKEKIDELKVKVAEARKEFIELRGNPKGDEPSPDGRPKRAVARQKWNRLQAELMALDDPAAHGNAALGLREGKQIGNTELRIRGEAEKLGPVIERGFLDVLAYEGQPKINPGQSGRLELATWLMSEKNPLPSRVMVNRIWKHLFGQGIVTTVDNFGMTGDAPSHPELLDHLARRFIADGWSVKKLIRSIVLSRAYQLASESSLENVSVDPGNRLVWRHSPRRLEAEELRDATLFIAGSIDQSRPTSFPVNSLRVIEIRNNGPEARDIDTKGRNDLHRSVYLPLLRGITPTSLAVFDFAEQGMVTGNRDTTTVPTQALYLLNDPFVRRQSLVFAERILAPSELSDEARLETLYRVAFGRSPSLAEIERASRYLSEYQIAAQEEFDHAVAVASKDDGVPPVTQADQAIAATNSPDNAIADPPAETIPPKADPTAAIVEQTKSAESSEPNGNGKKKKKQNATKPAQPVNPDEADQSDTPVNEEVIQARDARTAAWASYCQAILSSVEFRYVK